MPKKSPVDPPSLHVPSLNSSDVTGAVSQGVANDLHAELDSSDSDDGCYAVECRRRPPTVRFVPPVVDEAQPPARAEVQVEAEDEAVDVEVEEPLPVDDRGEIEEDEEGVGVGVEVSGSEEEIEEMLPEMVVETDLDDVLDRHSLSTVEEDDTNETLLDQSGDTVYETDSGEVVMDHEAEEYDTAAGSSSSDAEHDSSYDSASTSPVLPRPSNTVRRSERLAASAPPPVQSPPHRQLRVTPTASRASRRAAAATARAAAAAHAARAATASSAATNASRRSTRTIIPRTIYSYDTIGGEPSHVAPSSGPEDQS